LATRHPLNGAQKRRGLRFARFAPHLMPRKNRAAQITKGLELRGRKSVPLPLYSGHRDSAPRGFQPATHLGGIRRVGVERIAIGRDPHVFFEERCALRDRHLDGV